MSQLDQLIALFPVNGVFAQDLIKVVQNPCDTIALVCVFDVDQSKQRSFLAFDDHEVADGDNFEDFLDVNVGELPVVARDVSEHACDGVAHHGQLLGGGAPPDAISHVIDQ